jgi:tetratricopeptide (TPR) repeat protein
MLFGSKAIWKYLPMSTLAERFNLAVGYHQSGQLGPAENLYIEILQSDPGHADTWHLLGLLAGQVGRPDLAEQYISQSLRFRPDFAPAHFNLAVVHGGRGKLDEAETCCRAALSLKPDYAEAHNYLGAILHEQGKHPEAAACCREALSLKPDFVDAWKNLASALRDQGQLVEAEASLREALRLQPNSAESHCNLGVVLQEQGRLEEAEQSLRAALRHDSRLSGVWHQLATLLGARMPDADLAAMRLHLADATIPPGSRIDIDFGLAHVLDARQEYEEASRHLQQANALALAQAQQRGLNYDPATHSEFVTRMMEAFNPAFFERVRDRGVDSDKPIFIVGLPRSGTTLTEQILARHSKVFGAGELTLASENFLRLAGDGGDDWRVLENVARLDGPSIRALAAWHLDKLDILAPGASHVVDKMNDNYLYLGFLAALFPRAKFIHCRRDLRDVAVSCWITNFRSNRWANAFEHIASRIRDYERLANHWREVLPTPVLEVKYEELVADQEAVSRRLVSWCGLEWEPECLKFYEGTRPVRTASAMQVRQPIFSRSVARWKHYEKWLAPLFAMLPPQEE